MSGTIRRRPTTREGVRRLSRIAVVLSVASLSTGLLPGIASATPTQGSNGTVKVDGEPFDTGLGNEPHVDCSLRVDFYGFDVGTDTATVTFTAQPPSGSGTPVAPTSGPTTFTFTGTGPGNDLDNDPDTAQTYTLATDGLTAQAQQGYHVRVSTTVTNEQGVTTFSKTKVIWYSPCTPPPPVTPTAPTLAGVCTPATGAVTWTVTNPNAAALTGEWTVEPGGDSGTVVAAPGETQFGPTTGGTATVTFGATGLVAGPVTVPCAAPTLAAPTLAGVCDTTTGQVTWTLSNPNDVALTGSWRSGSDTGTVTAPANGSAEFTTAGGHVSVAFPGTGLAAVAATQPCVLGTTITTPPTGTTPSPTTTVSGTVTRPTSQVLGERVQRRTTALHRGAAHPTTKVKALRAQQLPFTGPKATVLVPYALGMVFVGTMLVLAGRRRPVRA